MSLSLPLSLSLIKEEGKSSLTVQFVDGHFVESYYPTIENTFSKTIKYKGQDFATEIIDTAGQVRRGLGPSEKEEEEEEEVVVVVVSRRKQNVANRGGALDLG